MLSLGWNQKVRHNRRIVSTSKVNILHSLLGRLSCKEDKSLANWFARHLPDLAVGSSDHRPIWHPGGNGNKGGMQNTSNMSRRWRESQKHGKSKEPYSCARQYISTPRAFGSNVELNQFPPNICRYPWRAPSPAYERQGRCRDGHSLQQFVHCKEFPITNRVLILFVTAAMNQNLPGTSLSGPVSPRKCGCSVLC